MNVKSCLLTIAITLAGTPVGQTSPPVSDLSQYAGENRLLLVFAPSKNMANFHKLHGNITQRDAALIDRDIIVFLILESGKSSVDGIPLPEYDANRLRSQFTIQPGESMMVLVGKDGSEKIRTTLAYGLSDMFQFIDAMPVRMQEIQAKRDTGETVTMP